MLLWTIAKMNTYLYVYRRSPWSGWTGFLPSKLLIEEDTLKFDWGKSPKSYPEKRPVCRRFSTDALTERSEATVNRNRHLLDFHQSLFSQVATLIPLGAKPIRLGWPLPGTEIPDGIARALPVATALPRWKGGWTLG